MNTNTISVQCPGCGHRLKVKQEYAGRRGKCPKCKGSVAIPDIPTSSDSLPVPATPQVIQPVSVPTPVPVPVPETAECPFCAEPIQATAKKCKHCGEFLDVTLRAAEEAKRSGMQQQIMINNVQSGSTDREREWNALVAFILSFWIPGLGQIYKGHVGAGIAWFIFVIGGYVMLIVPGLVLHIICLVDAATSRAAPR